MKTSKGREKKRIKKKKKKKGKRNAQEQKHETTLNRKPPRQFLALRRSARAGDGGGGIVIQRQTVRAAAPLVTIPAASHGAIRRRGRTITVKRTSAPALAGILCTGIGKSILSAKGDATFESHAGMVCGL